MGPLVEDNDQILEQAQRCPKLGGPVLLRYCMTSGETPLPCAKIMDCWWERIPIVSFLEKRLNPSEFTKLADTKPLNKMTQIMDLAAKARNSNRNEPVRSLSK